MPCASSHLCKVREASVVCGDLTQCYRAAARVAEGQVKGATLMVVLIHTVLHTHWLSAFPAMEQQQPQPQDNTLVPTQLSESTTEGMAVTRTPIPGAYGMPQRAASAFTWLDLAQRWDALFVYFWMGVSIASKKKTPCLLRAQCLQLLLQ